MCIVCAFHFLVKIYWQLLVQLPEIWNEEDSRTQTRFVTLILLSTFSADCRFGSLYSVGKPKDSICESLRVPPEKVVERCGVHRDQATLKLLWRNLEGT